MPSVQTKMISGLFKLIGVNKIGLQMINRTRRRN